MDDVFLSMAPSSLRRAVLGDFAGVHHELEKSATDQVCSAYCPTVLAWLLTGCTGGRAPAALGKRLFF